MGPALLAATGGITDGAGLADRVAGLGERPYSAPSVFNFYPPDFTIPGTDLFGPEFGIHNTSTAVARSNLFYSLLYGGIASDPTVPNATGTHIATTPLEALSSDPLALVDQLRTLLLRCP